MRSRGVSTNLGDTAGKRRKGKGERGIGIKIEIEIEIGIEKDITGLLIGLLIGLLMGFSSAMLKIF